MTTLRNFPGHLAIVVPHEAGEADIQCHGGKIVVPLKHGECALGGGGAWTTYPVLFDAYGNSLAWDDADLKPLGAKLGLESARQHRSKDSTQGVKP